MLGKQVERSIMYKEEEQKSFAYPTILTISVGPLALEPIHYQILLESLVLSTSFLEVLQQILILQITMYPALSAMLPQELQLLRFLLKLSVHLPGPVNTMDI